MNGEVLFSGTLETDWEPAVQGTRLAGLRRLGLWENGDGRDTFVEPLWDATAGRPTAKTFRVHMSASGRQWHCDFQTTQYFADAARVVVAGQLAAGRIAAADKVRFAIEAYPAESQHAGADDRLRVVDRPQPLRLKERGFSQQIEHSEISGESDTSDFELAIPSSVLDEIRTRVKAAGERETGGILIGHVCRDEKRADIGVEISAQIPARHTVGDSDKLTFTSETWTDVRNAVALRRHDELLLGWWHSHPAFSWCSKCPVEQQRVCHYATGFLSSDDKALHRSVFPSAYTQALVVTHSVSGIDMRLFGWRHGVLKPRGFRVVQRDEARHAYA